MSDTRMDLPSPRAVQAVLNDAARRLRRVVDHKVLKSRVRNYEPTMVTVSIEDLEILLAAVLVGLPGGGEPTP